MSGTEKNAPKMNPKNKVRKKSGSGFFLFKNKGLTK